MLFFYCNYGLSVLGGRAKHLSTIRDHCSPLFKVRRFVKRRQRTTYANLRELENIHKQMQSPKHFYGRLFLTVLLTKYNQCFTWLLSAQLWQFSGKAFDAKSFVRESKLHPPPPQLASESFLVFRSSCHFVFLSSLFQLLSTTMRSPFSILNYALFLNHVLL